MLSMYKGGLVNVLPHKQVGVQRAASTCTNRHDNRHKRQGVQRAASTCTALADCLQWELEAVPRRTSFLGSGLGFLDFEDDEAKWDIAAVNTFAVGVAHGKKRAILRGFV